MSSVEGLPQGAAALAVLGLFNRLPKTALEAKTEQAGRTFFRDIEETARTVQADRLSALAEKAPEDCREILESIRSIFETALIELGHGDVPEEHQETLLECCDTYELVVQRLSDKLAERNASPEKSEEQIKTDILNRLSIIHQVRAASARLQVSRSRILEQKERPILSAARDLIPAMKMLTEAFEEAQSSKAPRAHIATPTSRIIDHERKLINQSTILVKAFQNLLKELKKAQTSEKSATHIDRALSILLSKGIREGFTEKELLLFQQAGSVALSLLALLRALQETSAERTPEEGAAQGVHATAQELIAQITALPQQLGGILRESALEPLQKIAVEILRFPEPTTPLIVAQYEQSLQRFQQEMKNVVVETATSLVWNTLEDEAEKVESAGKEIGILNLVDAKVHDREDFEQLSPVAQQQLLRQFEDAQELVRSKASYPKGAFRILESKTRFGETVFRHSLTKYRLGCAMRREFDEATAGASLRFQKKDFDRLGLKELQEDSIQLEHKRVSLLHRLEIAEEGARSLLKKKGAETQHSQLLLHEIHQFKEEVAFQAAIFEHDSIPPYDASHAEYTRLATNFNTVFPRRLAQLERKLKEIQTSVRR